MGQRSLDVSIDSKIRVGQFFGIEIEEWPCRIAEVAMHIAAHLADLELSASLGGGYYAHFPIDDVAHIAHANSLRIDWETVLPSRECNYVLGNPPFIGIALMNGGQQEDRIEVMSLLGPKSLSGRLDYVGAWYVKALDYSRTSPNLCVAFVSTNSLFQGEQARTLAPILSKYGVSIRFAHRTFAWVSDASGAANVHVAIAGLSRMMGSKLRLYYYDQPRAEPIEDSAKHINVYLADAPDVVPVKRRMPLRSGLPKATEGSRPLDGGHLLVSDEEVEELASDPHLKGYLRPYAQSAELLYDRSRWCLWLVDVPTSLINSSPELRTRLRGVASIRSNSPTAAFRAFASTPSRFAYIRQPDTSYLAMPRHSSGRRQYIPARFFGPETVAGDALLVWPDADDWLFGILQSRAFTLWVDTVGGKLKGDYRLAPDLTYCTFPFQTLPRLSV